MEFTEGLVVKLIDDAVKEVERQHKEDIRVMDDLIDKLRHEVQIHRDRIYELRKLVKMLAREVSL